MNCVSAPVRRRSKSLALALLIATLAVAARVSAAAGSDVELANIVFPAAVGTFRQIETHRYDNPALGYQVKFESVDGSERLDVFVFPVGAANAHLSHEALVSGYLQQAQRGIEAAIKRGIYSGARAHGVIPFDAGRKTRVLKSSHTIHSAGREILSVIYVTERNGMIVKIRVSVRADAANIVLEEFETAVFDLIKVALGAL